MILVVVGFENHQCMNRINCALADIDAYNGQIDSLIMDIETNVKDSFIFENSIYKNEYDWDDFYERKVLRRKFLSRKVFWLTMETGTYLPQVSIDQDFISRELFLAMQLNDGIRSEKNELWINDEKIDINYKNEYELPLTEELFIELKHYALNYCNNKVDTTVLTRQIFP